jgi:holo-[acyl-carrier protein] synthase
LKIPNFKSNLQSSICERARVGEITIAAATAAAVAEMQVALPGLSIGADLVEIDRIGRAVERHGARFLRRVYTAAELAACGADVPHAAPRVASLAARWAAKEAVAKALGTGIGQVTWQEIEVLQDGAGCPGLQLHGNAARLAEARGLTMWALSLAHDGGLALAFVVAGQR